MRKMFVSSPRRVNNLANVVKECFCKIVGQREIPAYENDVQIYTSAEVEFILNSVVAMVNAYLKDETPEPLSKRRVDGEKMRQDIIELMEKQHRRQECQSIMTGMLAVNIDETPGQEERETDESS